MKNKIILHVFLSSFLCASLSFVDASKRMPEEELSETFRKKLRITAEVEEALPTPAVSPHALSPFEALLGELKAYIVSFIDDEETGTISAAIVYNLSQVSKSCNAFILDVLPNYDLVTGVSSKRIKPESIEVLKRFRSIPLSIKNPNDTLMNQMCQLGNIRRLTLMGGGLTRAGFTQLAGLSSTLLALTLSDAHPADATARDYQLSIGSLTRLTHFVNSSSYGNSNGVATPAVAHAVSGLTSLRSLDWGHVEDLNDDCVRFFDGLTNLKILNFSGTNITDASLNHLIALASLNVLLLDMTCVSDQAEASLRAVLTNLDELG